MQAALMPALLSSVEAKARVGHNDDAAAAAAGTYYVRSRTWRAYRDQGPLRAVIPGAGLRRGTHTLKPLAACKTLASPSFFGLTRLWDHSLRHNAIAAAALRTIIIR